MEFRSDGTSQGIDRYGRVVSGTFTFIDPEHMKLEMTTTSADKTSGVIAVDRASGVCKVLVEGDLLTMTDEGGSVLHYKKLK